MAGTLLLRADASAEMGTGHLMRGLALAQAWQMTGGVSVFVSHCPSLRLRERIQATHAAWTPVDQPHPHPCDVQTLTAAITMARASGNARSDPVWVALDGYHFDSSYQAAIRATGCRLLVVDDLAHLSQYHADLLVNQNSGAQQIEYPCEPETLQLLGSRYVLLRPEFQPWRNVAREIRPLARRLLVTFGGSDPHNTTATVLEALQQVALSGLSARIVIGPANPHGPSLRAMAQKSSVDVQLLSDIEEMSPLMAWADLAVAAAGSTCWELAFMRLPAAVIEIADNQSRVAQPLSAAGAVLCIGSHREATPEKVADAISSLCRDRNQRAAQSAAGAKLIDGLGASRVAAIMRAFDQPPPPDRFQLRRLTLDDRRALWRLANEPAVRRNSLATHFIAWQEHVAWFEQRWNDPACRIWVLDFRGILAGMIRYERFPPDTAEISIAVASWFRRQGLATRLIEETASLARAELHVVRLRAVVRQENLASNATFSKAGFAMIDSRAVKDQPCHLYEQTRP